MGHRLRAHQSCRGVKATEPTFERDVRFQKPAATYFEVVCLTRPSQRELSDAVAGGFQQFQLDWFRTNGLIDGPCQSMQAGR